MSLTNKELGKLKEKMIGKTVERKVNRKLVKCKIKDVRIVFNTRTELLLEPQDFDFWSVAKDEELK